MKVFLGLTPDARISSSLVMRPLGVEVDSFGPGLIVSGLRTNECVSWAYFGARIGPLLERAAVGVEVNSFRPGVKQNGQLRTNHIRLLSNARRQNPPK